MKTLILSYFTIFVVFIAVPIAAQEEESAPPDIEKMMTEEDYALSGLDKLTDVERAHLSKWVEKYREGAVKGPVVNRPPSQWTEEEKEAERNFEIVANVIPRFRGWGGKTTFRLDNGQVWQQRMPGRMQYTGTSSEVSITKNMMGRYVLQHVETERSVLVKRIE